MTPIAGGGIADEVIWTLAESPYVVQADLSIEKTGKLTLEPGVEVRFQKQDASNGGSDPARIELTVHGTLHAEGTTAAPIVLHPDDGDYPNSWYGVVVAPDAAMAALSHVEIEGANIAVSSAAPGQLLKLASSTLQHNFTGLLLTGGAPNLEALQLSSNSVHGLFVDASAADLTLRLRNSVCSLNGSYGVFVSVGAGHSANVGIFSSTLYGNISSGVTSKATGAGASTTIGVASSIVANNGIVGIDSSVLDGALADVSVDFSDLFSNGTDLMGVTAGEACLAEDPAFLDAPADLRLSAGSPCIDSATEADAPAVDLLGRARPQGNGFDMGAYEHVATDSVDAGGGAAGASSVAGADNAGGAPGEPTTPLDGGEAGRAPSSTAGTFDAPNVVAKGNAADGCACHVTSSAPSRRWSWLAAALLAALLRRKRSRRGA